MANDDNMEYNNVNTGMAISAAATTIIGIGAAISTTKTELGITIIMVGIGVYFLKGILMKKGCL